MPKKMKKTALTSIGVLIAALIAVYAKSGQLNFSSGDKPVISSAGGNNYSDILVKRVVDGDTLLLGNGERVRLIGIDTPEMHESNKLYRDSQRSGQDILTITAMGKRAYAFTQQLMEGKRVSLEFDVERHDRYNRLLAYVYLKDGTFVNAEIVKEGYASLMTYPPNVKYADMFLEFYRQARENKRGLWAD